MYYKILCWKSGLNSSLMKRETKWHFELNLIFSADFWAKSRKLCSDIPYDNRIRWLQHQIIRNSLPTNVIVSHFRNVSKLCDFCAMEDELVSHLFWSCNVVQVFIAKVKSFLLSPNIDFNPSKISFLFGKHDLSSLHPQNYLCLLVKRFIWT